MVKETKMHSLAENHEAIEVAKSPEQPYYPSMRLSTQQMPELKGSGIGDKVMILVEAEVESINEYKKGTIEYGLRLKAWGYSRGDK